MPLYFTTDVEITRPRWYWFDEKTIRAAQTVRISYNVLTRRYHAGAAGQLQQSFNTLDDALSLIRRPTRWLVAEKGALKAGETYQRRAAHGAGRGATAEAVPGQRAEQ